MRLPTSLPRLLAALLLPTALVAQAPGETHPYHPGIDVLDYDFTLDLPERGAQVEGRAVLTVHRTAPVDTLRLDLLAMRVDTVLVDGRPAAFRRSERRIYVPLPEGAGDTLRVAVRYGGEPADGLIIREGANGWTGFGDNWPNRGRHWLPTVDHPSDKATVGWTVRAPAGRKVVANGVLQEEAPLGDGRIATRWRIGRPIPVYLMVIGAARMERFDLGDTACGLREDGGCVPQSVFAEAEVRDFLPGPFAEAGPMVEHYARRVAPYPYEHLAHVQSSTRFGGMENATVIFYSDRAFRERTLGVGLIAHETVHQWFGNSVTPLDWPHLWLSEGFATYYAQLWTEESRGAEPFRAAMGRIRDGLLRSPVVAERPVLDTAQTDLMELLNANSYQKGGWVLHMLRSTVGDEAFDRGVAAYYAAHLHGNAVTDDLQREMERASGRELGWFFDQWLRRPGFVEVTSAWRYDAASRRVVLTVEQGTRFAPFRFPLTVEVVDAAGTAHRATVEVAAEAAQEVAIPVELGGAPREVRLDPDVQLLASFRAR